LTHYVAKKTEAFGYEGSNKSERAQKIAQKRIKQISQLDY